MPSDFRGNDPHDLWRNQPTEAFKMSANEMRRKARQHQTKSRSSAIVLDNRRDSPFRGFCVDFR